MLELGVLVFVDFDWDELVFYLLFYWFIDLVIDKLNEWIIVKIDMFMCNGGIILFDICDYINVFMIGFVLMFVILKLWEILEDLDVFFL